MKVQFIGTGSIGAKERSACTLINDEILIDLGNGNVKAIKQLGNDLLKIKAIFITHLHGDHYADMPFFILDRMIYQNNIKEDIKIYGPKNLEENTKVVHEILFGNYEKNKQDARISFEEVKEEECKEVGEYKVTPYLVDHGKVKPAYGYIVKNNEKRIGFSGDSIYCEAIDEIVKNSDISILDMSSKKTVPWHMGIEDIIKICEEYTTKTIIATHMHAETRILAKDLKIKNLIIPQDGDILEF